MATKKIKSKKVGGGTLPGPVRIGRTNEARNRLLVLARKVFADIASYQFLGEAFGIDKTTAEDIFNRDKDKYHV